MISYRGFEKINMSPFLKVRIPIQIGYQDGTGLSHEKLRNFELKIYPRLERQGFSIDYPENSGTCPNLITNKLKKFSIYMHPASFDGYATKEQIDKIIQCLDSADIKHESPITEEVYDLSNNEYRLLLAQNIDLILQDREKYIRIYGDDFDYEFEFAEKNRIPRAGDGPGRSSSDTDIEFINILNVSLTTLEKENSKDNLERTN